MAKKKSTAGKSASNEPTPSFEDALAELQSIVADLEDGALGLEQSLARFETGVGLLRTCYQVLEQAEQRVEILTGVDDDGNPITAPFDGTATYQQTEESASSAGRRRTATKRDAKNEPAGESSSEENDDEDTKLF